MSFMQKITKSIVAFLFGGVLVVNYLANALPINGRNTGEISDAYQNLFAPAGVTFSIWGLIYLLLLGYTVYQFGFFYKDAFSRKAELIEKMNRYFIVNVIANIAWVFAWHYDYILVSVLLMGVLLFTLIRIADMHRVEKFSLWEKLFLQLPFSIYFGWITVATIANITVFLVSIGWDGFGMTDTFWTIFILLVGALIGVWRMTQDKNIVYILVFIWAYVGIYIKHISEQGFDGQYPNIIMTVFLCLVLFVIFGVRLLISQKRQ
ncbi:MAG: tryptophan-rich sensory protein [Candidatus Moranbacteria bacterium]|nr:tryptophan-rich sensory protein [Candidatus Moranbacteria bacterium]